MHPLAKAAAIVLGFLTLVMIGYVGRDYMKLLGPPEKCWEIKEVDGQLYKSNPCTGQFLLLGDAPR